MDCLSEADLAAVPAMTGHANERLAQRAITDDTVAVVSRFGFEVHSGGAVFCMMRRRQIERARRVLAAEAGRQLTKPELDELRRTEGTVLILSNDGYLISAFRNRKFRLKAQ